MRLGEARPGQRVGLSATDIGRRLEGFFIFEEEDNSIVAVSFEPFRSAPDADGAALELFFIEVPTVNVVSRIPAGWAEDFVPAIPAGRTVPGVSQLMAAFDLKTTAVPSEAEDELTPRDESRRHQRVPPRVPQLPGRPAVSFAPRASGATGASALLAGAGLDQRQTNRIAQLYEDDLDEEDDDAASGSPQAAQEDDPLSQLLQGAGSVDAQTLASLDMIRLIREMRDEER